MPERFIFRQVYFRDIERFASDGEIRAKNHPEGQACHQTSYAEIVERRGTNEFRMPCGGVVNDYVPFYFSPITAFAYTIYKGNVQLRSPAGDVLGLAQQSDRAFIICKAEAVLQSECDCYFSSVALNSLDADVVFESSYDRLTETVNWLLFDEAPLAAKIPEIGYAGVCTYFLNRATPVAHQNRSRERMAEFLVRDGLPLHLVECIVVQNENIAGEVRAMLTNHDWDIPVYVKQGCFFQ